MELHAIETGRFKLDGGAMFGVVPKLLWQRTNPADDQNRIDMAMRCLLVASGSRLVLVDTGLGHKYDERFARNYAVDNEHSTLAGSLHALGYSPADITDVVMTHLHFDHGGGATSRTADGRLQPVFPNATIHVQRAHLHTAQHPNAREKASFLAENIDPLASSGQLNLLDGETELFPGFRLLVVNGHTEAMQLPLLQYRGRQLLYAADLFPTAGHIPLPYVMAYDMQPLLTLAEREHMLPWLADENVVLLLEHDPVNECCTVARTDKGGYTAGHTLRLSEV